MQKKDRENGDRKAPKYIYLPFIKKECSDAMLQEVLLCKQYAREIGVEGSHYQFIAYGGKQLSNLPPNSRIYIIGDGVGLSSIRIHEEDKDKCLSGGRQAITVNTLVERMIRDGLLDSDLLTIKLWFSDYRDNAVRIAEKFKTCLEMHQAKNRFFIDCYPGHSLCIPLLQQVRQQYEKHQWAVNIETEACKRASTVRWSLFFNTESEKLSRQVDEHEELSVFQDLLTTMNPFD